MSVNGERKIGLLRSLSHFRRRDAWLRHCCGRVPGRGVMEVPALGVLKGLPSVPPADTFSLSSFTFLPLSPTAFSRRYTTHTTPLPCFPSVIYNAVHLPSPFL